MSDYILKTEKLRKDIGKKTIVSDINLAIRPGEIYGFLGPNGAGKSTTIKMVVGLSSITDGNIYIDGHSVKTDFKSAMKEIGCIVENPELYKYMSGLDNLKLFAKLYDNVDENRINEVIDLVGMRYAIKNKVKTYSLGMKQRLGIAQALLNRPKLLILDEPTNGLDPAGIKAMRELLENLVKDGEMSVLVSSHILAEMQQMCNRVGIINHGRLITEKTVEELISLSNPGDKETVQVNTANNDQALEVLLEKNFSVKKEPDGLHIETNLDGISQVVIALVGANVPVYEVSRQDSHSLEDVFMQLTGEGK